jgi:hypothetical protein
LIHRFSFSILTVWVVGSKEMRALEKAQLRVELKKTYGLPAQPEPDL